jgi:hypothetical protein
MVFPPAESYSGIMKERNGLTLTEAVAQGLTRRVIYKGDIAEDDPYRQRIDGMLDDPFNEKHAQEVVEYCRPTVHARAAQVCDPATRMRKCRFSLLLKIVGCSWWESPVRPILDLQRG